MAYLTGCAVSHTPQRLDARAGERVTGADASPILPR